MTQVADTDRVALVTGAARGIGAAVVRLLCAEGWRVGALDRASDDPAIPYSLAAHSDLEALEDLGDQVTLFRADVRDPTALYAAVAELETRWGGLDTAVAAAGVIAGGRPAWELALEQERAVLDVDLGGVLNLGRAAVPALLRRSTPRRGRFVAVASAAATRGLPLLAAYCAAKAGVTGYVRGLAAELAGTGVTANAVNPGSTDTATLVESARLYGMESQADFASQQPIGRLLEPEEIARVIVFLSGDGGSAMTGAVVAVDGGLSV